jgi:asparagine synthase (glutamine-hydrolysing)
MCGIAGTVRWDGSQALAEDCASVAVMLRHEQHRGPDGEGMYADGPVVLGHRRLAIIDLSADGLQPMANETGAIRVTFNGEIYNYRELRAELLAEGHVFRSASDTEVLLHGYEQWGIVPLLKRLRGMFAFVLYDARSAAAGRDEPFFFAARDRLGIKPLYYSVRDNRLAFASEAKALLRGGLLTGDIDSGALATFLSLGSVSYPRTWLKGIDCLPPGHVLMAGRSGICIEEYWDLSYSGRPGEATMGELLHDAVQRHLIADVPAGVFLSGGVDSGAVAAMAARGHSAPISTLTITFEEQEFDEAAQARAYAKAFGTDHHEIAVTSRDFSEELPKLLEAMDQPTADGVNTYFVSRAARQLGLKVVLSGLGGDEVFFGYHHYRTLVTRAGALGGYLRSSPWVQRLAAQGASFYGRLWGAEKWRRFDYRADRCPQEAVYLLLRGFFPPHEVCRLLGTRPSELKAVLDDSFAATGVFGANGHVDANRFNCIELRRYLHDQLLRDSDVFSMAHSIELRVPLLDNEVVEACCRIPAAEKIASGINKPKLVEALDHPAIAAAARRPKRGFTFPFAKWMLAQADELQERALQGKMLDPAAVRDCWRQFRAGRLHWSRAWATVVLAALNN